MEMKETFQIAKQLYRLGFCFICGMIFHYLFAVMNLYFFNMCTFISFLAAFYYFLDRHEKSSYTDRIEAMKEIAKRNSDGQEDIFSGG